MAEPMVTHRQHCSRDLFSKLNPAPDQNGSLARAAIENRLQEFVGAALEGNGDASAAPRTKVNETLEATGALPHRRADALEAG